MAKSLRSKSKRAFRAKKRTGTGSTNAYALADALRLERLSTKLRKSALQPKVSVNTSKGISKNRKGKGREVSGGDSEMDDEGEKENFDGAADDGYETEDEGDHLGKGNGGGGTEEDSEKVLMDLDSSTSKPSQKISTSGPRLSRRETFRAAKGLRIKRSSATLFGKRGNMGGKPSRRR